MSRTKAVLTRVARIRALDKQIARLQQNVKTKKAEQAKLEKEAIAFMEKDELDSVKSGSLNVSIKEVDVPSLKNFKRLWEFAKKNNAPELFQRRVNAKAWRDRDMNVPGVGVFTKKSLSITKRRR